MAGMDPDGQVVGRAVTDAVPMTAPQTSRLEVLHALDHVLMSADSRADLAGATARLLRGATGADRVAVWFGDSRSHEVLLLASDPPVEQGLVLGVDAVSDLARERFLVRDPVRVDVVADGTGLVPLPLPAWVQSWCALPLVDGDGPMGAITIASRQAGGFDADVVETARSAGDHLAMALRKLILRDELRETAVRMAAILDATPNGVLLVGRGSEVLHANRAAELLIGIPAEALVGRPIDGVVPDLTASAESLLGGRQRTGDRRPELALRRGDGELVSVEVGIARLPLNDGPGMVVTLVDVAERRALERRLLQAEKMEMAGQIASMAAHDFRNYLSVIGGFAELLAEEVAVGEPREDLDQIRTAVARGQESVAAMLTFARPAGDDDLTAEPEAHLRSILPLLVSLARPRAAVELDAAAHLPAVAISPSALTQILMNLVANSRDAMPAGGTIRVNARTESPVGWARRASDAVVVEVVDTGIGMDAPTLRRVFEPFFTTKPAGEGLGEGSGLGLTSVRLMVGRVGGTVEVASIPGAGSTVRLRIPIRSAPLAAGGE